MAALIPWAGLGAVSSSPTVGAHADCLAILEVACTVATTDGSISVLGALLVTCEALEASLACALSTLGTLLSQILLTDVAAALTRAEVSRRLVASRALVLADVAEESFVAIAYWLKLVVHSALTMSRAQVLVLVTRAKEVALATKEARHTVAGRGAILTNCAVTLARADRQCAALALTTRAFERTLVTKEARVACALVRLLWSSAAAHERAGFQEEGGVSVELFLAG